MKTKIIFIQKILQGEGFQISSIDGISGPETKAAINAYLKTLRSPAKDWDEERQLVAAVQHAIEANGIETGSIDGYWGPQSEHAFEVALYYIEHGALPEYWRDAQVEEDESNPINPNGWPSSAQQSLIDFYGEPGDRSQMIVIDLPFPMRIAWNPSQTVTRTTVHEKVADSLLRILNRIQDEYGLDRIQELGIDLFGGVFNKRLKRGGSTWSTHSWAIAIDLDPAKNPLRAKCPQASFCGDEFKPMIKAFEDEGWTSLGRAKNYDWMHFQATK